MKRKNLYFKVVCWLFAGAFALAGCADGSGERDKVSMENGKQGVADETNEEQGEADSVSIEVGSSVEAEGSKEVSMEAGTSAEEDSTEAEASLGAEASSEPETSIEGMEPEIVDADWSEYFNGLNGEAVVYDVTNRRYTMYNGGQAMEGRSPCSTFKIISSLIGLENGIIVPEDSVRAWSGETFWNKDWNKDIDFEEAFRTSCVWYYRQVIDDIGKELMQKELDRLQYGNCDISDWEGRLNTNNNNRALTGFWIESSLLISPKEQVEVMERIFGENSDYSESTRKELKQVMLVSDQDGTEVPIYGKTGMGMAEGIVVDAWFTGFAEGEEGNLYFCVHLGRTDNMEVSSPLAKEIAIKIVADYFGK